MNKLYLKKETIKNVLAEIVPNIEYVHFPEHLENTAAFRNKEIIHYIDIFFKKKVLEKSKS